MLVDEGLELLSPAECQWLLGSASIGRVVMSIGGSPAAFPVNYGMLDRSIVFFSGDGLKLRHAYSDAVIAFEVDSIDEVHRQGWSVLATGTAHEVLDDDVVCRAREAGVRPWVSGNRSHLVAITPEILTGRRIIPTAISDDPNSGQIDR